MQHTKTDKYNCLIYSILQFYKNKKTDAGTKKHLQKREKSCNFVVEFSKNKNYKPFDQNYQTFPDI